MMRSIFDMNGGSARLHAKKSLGQHFLVNKKAISTIIDALELTNNDTVIEIGPGAGALTYPLLERMEGLRMLLIAIEKDEALAERLRINLPAQARNQELRIKDVEVITGDALKILPSVIHNSCFMLHNSPTNYKLVGNIPYYITGRLLRVISELTHKPERTIIMIQKEVAERICAKPPNMNLLSVITQFWADPEIIFRLSPSDFSPPPKVDSAILKLTTRLASADIPADHFYSFCKTLFAQPRKTILNNLTHGLHHKKNGIIQLVERVGVSASLRPEQLTMEQLIQLARALNS